MNLGFFNFTTLRRRHHYLQEDSTSTAASVRRSIWRFCPSRARGPNSGRWPGQPVEYTLQMVQIPQDRMMDEVVDRGDSQLAWTEHCPAGAVLRAGRHRTRINSTGNRPSSPTTMRRTFPGPKSGGQCFPGNYSMRFATLPGLSFPGTGPIPNASGKAAYGTATAICT